MDAIVSLVLNENIRAVVAGSTRYYSLIDFVGQFADTKQNPRQYWNDVKKAMIDRYGFEASDSIRQLKLLAKDGKMRLTDCGDIVTIRRVIMSIPSAKAEPLRMWLAGKQDAETAYRAMLALQGVSLSGDEIHNRLISEGYVYPEDDSSAWEDLGYTR